MDIDWFQSNRKTARIRLRAMMESGQLVDEVADIVQTQVIAHKARASLRNRDAVPLYHHTEENRPPAWRENLIVETGLAPPPGMDSRYVQADSLNLWKGIKTGAVETDGESKMRTNILAITANAAAIVAFMVCGWLAGLNIAPEAVPAVEAAAHQTEVEGEAAARAAELEAGYALVDEMAGETGGEEGEGESSATGSGEKKAADAGGTGDKEGGGGGGATGSGSDSGISEQPVGPGLEGDAETDNAPDLRGPPTDRS